jgi:hypothetical protein
MAKWGNIKTHRQSDQLDHFADAFLNLISGIKLSTITV